MMSGYDNSTATTVSPSYNSCSDPARHTGDAGLISEGLRTIFEASFQVVICGTISVVGSVANVINIIVFCKQGFRDTISISLLGLSISDLGALITFILISVLRAPLFVGSEIFLNTHGITYLVAGWPHACFAIISSWITVFITFERCLCIAQPLQVKTIITRKRTKFIIVAIFGAMFALIVPPVYYTLRLGPRFVKQYNRTLVIMVQINNGLVFEEAVLQFNIFCQISTFSLVIICTVVLIRSLTLKTKWRRETANVSTSDSRDAMSCRDERVARLVIFISCIFIFSYLPSMINRILTVCFSPQYAMNGRYESMFTATWTLLNTFEAINSSINIIVYFKMSSKYRAVLTSMFCLVTSRSNKK